MDEPDRKGIEVVPLLATIPPGRDETRLLEDQQDVTPMGLAYQAIELGSSQNPLDASLRRVIKAMKL